MDIKEKGYEEEYINRISIDRDKDQEVGNAKKMVMKLLKNFLIQELAMNSVRLHV